MKIGILGAGNVGGSLGKAWAARGHQIAFGVRDPRSDKTQALLAEVGANAQAVSIPEAVAFGEIVVVAIRWPAVEEVVKTAGDWAGKILIDATNRFTPPPPGSTGSAAEDLARAAPAAKVVKAFNTVGAEHFANPRFGSQTVSMFICGDDDSARKTVAGLAQELGFDIVDAGPLSSAPMLESLAKLWVHLSRTATGRDIGFALLRR